MSVPKFEATSICRRCLRLYDREPIGGLRELCACGPAEPRWPGFDFNQRIELCRCCQAEVLPSGSKFSVWFCGPCKELIVHFNDEMRRWLIPTGRHSFMVRTYEHGPGILALAGPVAVRAVQGERDAERQVRTFNRGLVSMVSSQDTLDAWSRRTLGGLLDELGFASGTDADLSTFLELRSASESDSAFAREALVSSLKRYTLEQVEEERS